MKTKEDVWDEVTERYNCWIWAGDEYTEAQQNSLFRFAKELLEVAYDAGFQASRESSFTKQDLDNLIANLEGFYKRMQ